MHAQASEVLKALMTPLVGLIAAYVAYRQWSTSHQKIVLDFFEKRFLVFASALDAGVAITRRGTPDIEDVIKTRDAFTRSQFLFGSEVSRLLKIMFDNVIWLNHYTDKVISLDDNQEREKNLGQERARRFGSLSQLIHGGGVKAFKPYMTCDQKSRLISFFPRRFRPGRFD